MTLFLLLLGFVLMMSHVFPKSSDTMSWILLFGILFPVTTFGAGSFAWLLLNLASDSERFASLRAMFWCCLLLGMPLSGLMTWYLRKDDA